jgi:hypothetical protein
MYSPPRATRVSVSYCAVGAFHFAGALGIVIAGNDKVHVRNHRPHP